MGGCLINFVGEEFSDEINFAVIFKSEILICNLSEGKNDLCEKI